ncbi:MAG TPA: DUF1559 domain-containing protein [Pirellulales bacterium]|jgi:prepilin-type N-terminal cleavage/methylation domain-containing protein/prepilin-type processing-associated H-X9-DG protein|nr:DUF1559 domain-containing protein [Pirellulales bacterium]
MAPNKNPRLAFTLVELLVVIAIIGVLVALLLPAIQAAREAARRTSCNNNLKNLGIAVLNFHDSHRKLPTSNRAAGVTNAPRYAWSTLMLPYFEEQNVYDLYDFSKNWDASTAQAPKSIPNSQLVSTRLAVFECPSVPEDARLDGDLQYWTQSYTDWKSSQVAAPTDYAPITQVESKLVQFTDAGGQAIVDQDPSPTQKLDRTGMLLRNTVATLRHVTDGTSNTILLAESAGRPYVYRKAGRAGDLTANRVNGGGWCRPASEFGLMGSSEDGLQFPGACAINCANGEDYLKGGADDKGIVPLTFGAPYGTNGTSATFAFHPGGANILFGDGSVHFLNDSINIRVYARLVTRKGGEVVSDGDLDL